MMMMMMMFGPHELPLQLRVQILLLLDFLFHHVFHRRGGRSIVFTTTTTHLLLLRFRTKAVFGRHKVERDKESLRVLKFFVVFWEVI
jgi:hypothetical protein